MIGILAAITIVAFNGVQNKAKITAAQSAVAQANKKILAYAVLNSDQYPPDLTAAGMTDTQGLEYSYNNNASPRTYGVTATSGTFSYYMSNTTTQPTTGGYAGHGSGGVAAITNYVLNPSVESNLTGWNANFGTGGVGVALVQTTTGISGSNFYRMQWSTGSTDTTRGGEVSPIAATPGQSYTASMSIRVTRSQRMNVLILFSGASGGIVQTAGASVVVPINTWTTLSVINATAPAGTTYAGIRAYSVTGTGASTWQAGDILDLDAAMFVSGANLYNYADGNSANWAWTGTANNSTSTGIPL